MHHPPVLTRPSVDRCSSEEKSIVEMMDQEDAPMDVDSDNFLPPPITRPKRSLGKRQLASISPRLGQSRPDPLGIGT
jgi:hypothetical protein